MMKKYIFFCRNQLIMCLAAVPLGAVTGLVCVLFGKVLNRVINFHSENYLFFLPFLGAAGALIVWCYSKFGKGSDRGMALLFEVYQEKRSSIPLRLVPMIIGSTWLTHLFGGSAGREGAAVQIGGTLGSYLGDKTKISNGNKIMMISGMAAGFSGLFRIPLAAVFFSLEVLRRGAIEYSALLPALVSAYTANCVTGLFGLEKFTRHLNCEISLGIPEFMKLILLGVLFGLAGMLFSLLMKKLRAFLPGLIKNDILRILAFGTAIGLLSLVFRDRYSGLGTNLITDGFSGNIMPWDFALKMIFTALCLTIGYTGGEFTPLFSIGASLGFVLSGLIGLPSELCVALGYISVLGSATNTFISPVFIGAELFGTEYIPVFMTVCAVARICNGNQTIYPLQEQQTLKADE